MYYDIILVKLLEIPMWVKDREYWEPYLMYREVKLPFIPSPGIILQSSDFHEIITTITYRVDENELVAAATDDCSAGEALKEGVNVKKVGDFLNDLSDDYISRGWSCDE